MQVIQIPVFHRRGSQEPRGSKSSTRVNHHIARMSRLARASWIEIINLAFNCHCFLVEARKSLVDRNFHHRLEDNSDDVEARKSLVDRNANISGSRPCIFVEARKRLVDRNSHRHTGRRSLSGSRLARASWIEIFFQYFP